MTTITLKPLLPPASLPDAPNFKRRYSSDTDDLINDFFVPALSRAVRYDRAVGYFTAGSLARLAPALDAFLDRGDRVAPIRVAASPNLPKMDQQHMALGYQQRTIEQECTQHRPEFSDALGAVTWMIQHKRMEFWLITGYIDGTECLYHEKIGVIEDAEGNYLTFEGSPNETAAGLGANIESFPVHRSWVHGEEAHAQEARAAVDDLFDPANPRRLQITPFPEALQEGLVRTYTPHPPRAARRSPKVSSPTKTSHSAALDPVLPQAPEGTELRPYQSEAIRKWVNANGKGLLAMATGTGKTVTALGAAAHCARVYAEPPGLAVIILVPDNSLVDMWRKELRKWGVTAACSNPPHNNIRRLEDALRQQRVQGGAAVAVWTAQSAVNPAFQSVLNDFPCPRLLIADECHALGSDRNQTLLTEQFHYRLGLSATVERHLDPEGTDLLMTYFGTVLEDIGIKRAIEMGALCHYNYYPVPVSLNDDEMHEYARLSKLIGQNAASPKRHAPCYTAASANSGPQQDV